MHPHRHLNTSLTEEVVCNGIVILLAEPLVEEAEGKKLNPLPRMPISRENMLNILAEKYVYDLTFATHESLLTVLCNQSNANKILHIVGHGNESVLNIECGRGGLQEFTVPKIQELTRPIAIPLIIITACESEQIGQAFVDAGVSCVICCRGRVTTDAVLTFAKMFYDFLPTNTIHNSFQCAQLAVKYQCMSTIHQEIINQFILLSSNTNVSFRVETLTRTMKPTVITKEFQNYENRFPSLSSNFLGRQVEVYDILCKLGHKCKVIHLKGQAGMGKSALANFVAKYGCERRIFQSVACFPPRFPLKDTPLDQKLYQLSNMLKDRQNYEYDTWILEFKKVLSGNTLLLVVNIHHVENYEVTSLPYILQKLVNENISIKILIISKDQKIVTPFICSTMELKPLTFYDMVCLFGLSCPLVDNYKTNNYDPIASSVEDLLQKIFLRNTCKEARTIVEAMSKREAKLFSLLGNGNPRDIERQAKNVDACRIIEMIAQQGDDELTPLEHKNEISGLVSSRLFIQKKGIIQTYRIPHPRFPFTFRLLRGGVQDYSSGNPQTAGIVVSSNERCIAKNGILGSVLNLGGATLMNDVRSLPTLRLQDDGYKIRCHQSDSVMVMKGPYEQLQYKCVIFAVAPMFDAQQQDNSKKKVKRAYLKALERASQCKLESISFSLIGANLRADGCRKEIIASGVEAIINFPGYQGLKEINVFGYLQDEADELEQITKSLYQQHFSYETKIDPWKKTSSDLWRLEKNIGEVDAATSSVLSMYCSNGNVVTSPSLGIVHRVEPDPTSYDIRNGIKYFIKKGSVESFSSLSSRIGIVVASNELCSSRNSGVLAQITISGGPELEKDVKTLPTQPNTNIRCQQGSAVIVGSPKRIYGSLKVPFIIFAVASKHERDRRVRNQLLRDAYRNALRIAEENKLEAVAFSMLGAGKRCHNQQKKEAIGIGVKTIFSFTGYQSLKEIHHYGYNDEETHFLIQQCQLKNCR
jgi:O-acetyl-ADP-ribose deacetylase (regulator of RNase III)